MTAETIPLQEAQLIIGLVITVATVVCTGIAYVYRRGKKAGKQEQEKKTEQVIDDSQMKAINNKIQGLENSINHRIDDLNAKLDAQDKVMTDHMDDDQKQFSQIHSRVDKALVDIGEIKQSVGTVIGKLDTVIRFMQNGRGKEND